MDTCSYFHFRWTVTTKNLTPCKSSVKSCIICGSTKDVRTIGHVRKHGVSSQILLLQYLHVNVHEGVLCKPHEARLDRIHHNVNNIKEELERHITPVKRMCAQGKDIKKLYIILVITYTYHIIICLSIKFPNYFLTFYA